MNREEFVKRYYDIVFRALTFCEKARREGLLALEKELDREKVNGRDQLQGTHLFVEFLYGHADK